MKFLSLSFKHMRGAPQVCFMPLNSSSMLKLEKERRGGCVLSLLVVAQGKPSFLRKAARQGKWFLPLSWKSGLGWEFPSAGWNQGENYLLSWLAHEYQWFVHVVISQATLYHLSKGNRESLGTSACSDNLLAGSWESLLWKMASGMQMHIRGRQWAEQTHSCSQGKGGVACHVEGLTSFL